MCHAFFYLNGLDGTRFGRGRRSHILIRSPACAVHFLSGSLWKQTGARENDFTACSYQGVLCVVRGTYSQADGSDLGTLHDYHVVSACSTPLPTRLITPHLFPARNQITRFENK